MARNAFSSVQRSGSYRSGSCCAGHRRPTLTVVGPSRTVAAASAVGVPALIVDAGEHATRGFPEFFDATFYNKNTRVAYLHAVDRFSTWCERHRIGELADIEPLRVVAYIEALENNFEKPTVNST